MAFKWPLRMDSYLMIAILELGCCLDLLVHGVIHVRSAQSAPKERPLK